MYSRLGGRFLSKNDTIASVTTPGRRDHPTKVLTEPANMPSKLWYRVRNNIAVSLRILSSMQNVIPQTPKLGCSVDARRGMAPSSSRLARPSTRQVAILRASALSDQKRHRRLRLTRTCFSQHTHWEGKFCSEEALSRLCFPGPCVTATLSAAVITEMQTTSANISLPAGHCLAATQG
jgi:hypothetical protein